MEKLETVIFHMDIDAFYASVEQRDNPAFKAKPVIVGAKPGSRGVVSACSYEARRFGIHSAMPISQAYQKCPGAVFLPVRIKRYLEVSKSIMNLLEKYSPVFQQISIDEAFLDFTGTERLMGPPVMVAKKIKEEVLEKEQLTISIGIAPNRYLAKLASEIDKPDGLFQIKRGEEISFLDTLKLKHLWGLGEKTLERLKELNINSIPRLRAFSQDILASMLGKSTAGFLYKIARGMDPGIHSEEPKSRSVSSEITFEEDITDTDYIKKILLELSSNVMSRLINENLKSKTLCVKIRYQDFSTTTIQKTFPHDLTSTEEIKKLAFSLFSRRWDGHTPIRLLGVSATNILPGKAPAQMELFEQPEDKKKKVETAVNLINQKMKKVKITRASLLDK
jgi:DNA polymerase-4